MRLEGETRGGDWRGRLEGETRGGDLRGRLEGETRGRGGSVYSTRIMNNFKSYIRDSGRGHYQKKTNCVPPASRFPKSLPY